MGSHDQVSLELAHGFQGSWGYPQSSSKSGMIILVLKTMVSGIPQVEKPRIFLQQAFIERPWDASHSENKGRLSHINQIRKGVPGVPFVESLNMKQLLRMKPFGSWTNSYGTVVHLIKRLVYHFFPIITVDIFGFSIWRFPNMGTPSQHPFLDGIFTKNI